MTQTVKTYRTVINRDVEVWSG